MTVEEYIQLYIKSGAVKVDQHGRFTGVNALVVSVGIPKNGVFGAIPPRLDRDGDPFVEPISKRQLEWRLQNGWQEVVYAPTPKSLTSKTETDVASDESQDEGSVSKAVHRRGKKPA